MPKPSGRQQVEQARERMKIPADNPFDKKKTSSGQEKPKGRPRAHQPEQTPQKFEHVTDERPNRGMSHVQQNFIQTSHIRERVS